MTTPEELLPTEIVTGLPRVVTPRRAAEILRRAGLEEITECALRTRAYRKQIPFHRNGHRIIFTIEDLCEIAQGTAYHPEAAEPAELPERSAPAARPAPRRRAIRVSGHDHEQWRARRPRDA